MAVITAILFDILESSLDASGMREEMRHIVDFMTNLGHSFLAASDCR